MGHFLQFGPANAMTTKLQGLAVELYLDTTLFVDQRNHFGPGSVVPGGRLPTLQERSMRAVRKHEDGMEALTKVTSGLAQIRVADSGANSRPPTCSRRSWHDAIFCIMVGCRYDGAPLLA
jgi:hypothetical protein